jgi:hypothetical protein
MEQKQQNENKLINSESKIPLRPVNNLAGDSIIEPAFIKMPVGAQ